MSATSALTSSTATAVVRLPRPAAPLSDNVHYDETPAQGARQREAQLRWSLGRILAGDTSPESWQAQALCAETDPEAFFPEKGGSTREAKRICTGCDVKAQCLASALANDERFGIWGGLSERERRRLRRAGH